MSRSRRRSWDEEDPAAAAVLETLGASGLVAPLELGGADETSWTDCDLASFAENRLGEIVDPFALDAATRERFRATALAEPLGSPSGRRDLDRCAWLLSGGERAGTIALATSTLGGTRLRVSSLYVRPSHRRRGIASNALRAVRDALHRHDLGLKLATSWTWPRTVRFYARLGMWVHMWKRDLELSWDAAAPAPLVVFDGDRASLSVEVDERRIVLVEARRDGERLVLDEKKVDERGALEDVAWHATSTLALHLALEGWPLVRSPEDWKACYFADAGAPEALGYKIVLWEAWARKHRWRVDTPKLHGLAYATWDELEERWAAEAKELGID